MVSFSNSTEECICVCTRRSCDCFTSRASKRTCCLRLYAQILLYSDAYNCVSAMCVAPVRCERVFLHEYSCVPVRFSLFPPFLGAYVRSSSFITSLSLSSSPLHVRIVKLESCVLCRLRKACVAVAPTCALDCFHVLSERLQSRVTSYGVLLPCVF